MARDSQRSKVYAWERRVARLEKRSIYQSDPASVEAVAQWINPIWIAERARYGRPSQPCPEVRPAKWGQTNALAYVDRQVMALPRWSRNQWVIVHELTHLLLPVGTRHGPRFVGALIGVASRHLDFDPDELLAAAEEFGLKVDRRTIGAVPERGIQWRSLRALKIQGPMTPMDLACWLSIGTGGTVATERQVRASLLRPIAAGKVRLLRGKLHLLADRPTQTIQIAP